MTLTAITKDQKLFNPWALISSGIARSIDTPRSKERRFSGSPDTDS